MPHDCVCLATTIRTPRNPVSPWANATPLKGKKDEAFTQLKDAVEHDRPYTDDIDLTTTADLKSLNGDPRFDALLAEAKQHAAAAAK